MKLTHAKVSKRLEYMCKRSWALKVLTRLLSAVGNMSGYTCVSDCRSGGQEFVWSHNCIEIDHEIISMVILLPSADSFKKVFLSATSESMCTKYLLTTCSSLLVR